MRRAISMAVPAVSPVTTLTCMPARLQLSMAAGTSSRTGSFIAATPIYVSPPAFARASASSLPAGTSLYANASVRMACDWYFLRRAESSSFCSWLILQSPATISGAPFTKSARRPSTRLSTSVAMYLRSVEKVSWFTTPASARSTL